MSFREWQRDGGGKEEIFAYNDMQKQDSISTIRSDCHPGAFKPMKKRGFLLYSCGFLGSPFLGMPGIIRGMIRLTGMTLNHFRGLP
jgi:hypothetical protein